MICLVVELHLPSGRTERRQVVETDSGIVVSVSPFGKECQSMLLIESAYIVPHPLKDVRGKDDMHTHYRCDGGYACLCIKDNEGNLVPLIP